MGDVNGRRRIAVSIENLEPRVLFAAAEIVRNGGFEGAFAQEDWVRTGSFQADSRFTAPHTGTGYAYLATSTGSAGNSLTGTMYQTLTIPAVATSATLSFWTRITTSETTTTAKNDTMTVRIQNGSGTSTLQTVATLSNLNASSGYVQQTVALNSSLIGQTVRVFFTASTNSTLATTFRVDDVSLQAQIPATTTNSTKRVVGYLPYYRQSSFPSVDLSMLTHINYFSIQATDAGGLLTPNINEASLTSVVQAAHAMGKTVSMTVGPIDFTNLAASQTARRDFATNILGYLDRLNLDGVDIDWEPPAGNNVANYGLLIDELYTALSPSHKLITAAVNPWTNEIPAASVNAKMDWLNVMCYDFAPANHSTYSDAVSGMVDWTNYGVTKSKLVMGVPFYGRTGTLWSNTKAKTYTAIVADYKTVNGVYPPPDVDSYKDAAGATYYFNGVNTIAKKAAYVRDNAYGGMMTWELGQDWFDSTSNFDGMSLLPVMNSIMRPPTWVAPSSGSQFNYIHHAFGVTTGTVGFSADAGATDAQLAVTVNSGATVNFRASQKLKSLTIAGAATLTAGGAKTIVTGSISITGAGKLDLTDNDLIVDYGTNGSVPADVEALVKRGFNNGGWNGTGIYSSTAAAPSSNGNYALGVADNGKLTNPFGNGTTSGPLFSGQSVDNTTVLVKYTHRVDLDLDGRVTGNDAAIFNGAFSPGDLGANWMSGDVDLDGQWTSNDASIFNSFYDESLAQM